MINYINFICCECSHGDKTEWKVNKDLKEFVCPCCGNVFVCNGEGGFKEK